MKTADAPAIAKGNRLLDALPADVHASLAGRVKLVSFDPGQVVIPRAKPITHVFFPTRGMLSMVTYTSDGTVVETAGVGREGVAGVQTFLGEERLVQSQVMGQVEGEAVSMPTSGFREATKLPGPFRSVVEAYLRTMLLQIGQGLVCNAVHAAPERAARWLLEAQDRVGGPKFVLTQDFLSQMLGTRRATVTDVMGHLKEAKVVDYQRGHITILDRKGLEDSACECYQVIAAERERHLPGPG